MLRFVSRSIDLLEEMADETNNLFRLNRRGYLFVTAQELGVERLRDAAREVSGFGMGDLREHPDTREYSAAPVEGYRSQPTGADFLLGDAALSAFPFLTRATMALHVRRAGWCLRQVVSCRRAAECFGVELPLFTSCTQKSPSPII